MVYLSHSLTVTERIESITESWECLQFNPYDLELAGGIAQRDLLLSIAILAKVPVGAVRFFSSLYPPVSECNQKPECNLEFQIDASSQSQIEGVVEWGKNITRQVTSL